MLCFIKTKKGDICYMYVNEPSKVHDSFSSEKDKKIKLDMLTTF
jgi:hypothetical protein